MLKEYPTAKNAHAHAAADSFLQSLSSADAKATETPVAERCLAVLLVDDDDTWG